MLTNSNTSLSNLVILATLSSSVVSLNHETESYLTPQHEAKFEHHVNIADWKDNAFNSSFDYSFTTRMLKKSIRWFHSQKNYWRTQKILRVSL